MTNELEDRLAALESELRQNAAKQSAKPKKTRRRWAWAILIILIAGLAGGGVLYTRSHRSQPIPVGVQKSVNFPLYFPNRSNTGYTFVQSSPKNQNGILFFDITNGSQTISLTQQALPVNPPNLSYYEGFKKVDIPAGDAIVGSNANKPIVIINTNTTLIIMTGPNSLPTDALVTLAKAMGSVTQ